MYYNKVIIIGRLVREPESMVLPSGSQVSNLVVAYNRNYKTSEGTWKEESHFFEVKVFGKLAERVIPQLGKGDLVLIEGRLHQDKWLDKQTGEPRSKIRIVAFDVKPLSKVARGAASVGEEPLGAPEIPTVEKTSASEEPKSETFEELEELLFGDEENKENPSTGENKKGDLDDFDIVL